MQKHVNQNITSAKKYNKSNFSNTAFLALWEKSRIISPPVADIFTSRHLKLTADSNVTCFILSRRRGEFEKERKELRKIFTDEFHLREMCRHLSTQWTATKYGQTVNPLFVPDQPGGLSHTTACLGVTVCVYTCVTFCMRLCHPQPKHLHHSTTCRQTNN